MIYHPLLIEDLEKIVEIQIALLKQRLGEKQIQLVLTSEAQKHLAREGYDPVYGARPLKRIIQRDLLNPLSIKLIEGSVHAGDKITINFEAGQLIFH